ncbi:peptide/nickel transport system permease protein [Pseudomonas sp. NFIX10]|uniref:ABC transporter permease n=1 Tax=unclassified Pseudomonas TaxID=196821 RepID=UPI0008EAB603|nr:MULTISPECIES: ABC transporter permease [unclassified Pseudomonas]SFB02211.1 peptide/nickel transport system permease protein [Pseudomonas sp. NFIX10]SFE56643.1 peptide/nickel transport system permease protein [Pseudomonas sp. NFACC06-1]
MIRLLSIRLLQAFMVPVLVGTLTFLSIILQLRTPLSPDQSVLWLFLGWLGDVLTFDLGSSIVSGEPVLDRVAQSLGSSIPLAVGASILSLLIGPPLGIIAGLRRGGWVDRALLLLSTAIRAIPQFVLAIILVLIFAVAMGLLPTQGHATFAHSILPTASLALALAAVSSLVARDATLAVTSAPHYASGRLEGLTAFTVFRQHGLRHIRGPIVTALGVQLVYLMEGIIVVETVFAWPGIGMELVRAIADRDSRMVQGSALGIGLMFVLLKTILDLVNHSIDSRRRNS